MATGNDIRQQVVDLWNQAAPPNYDFRAIEPALAPLVGQVSPAAMAAAQAAYAAQVNPASYQAGTYTPTSYNAALANAVLYDAQMYNAQNYNALGYTPSSYLAEDYNPYTGQAAVIDEAKANQARELQLNALSDLEYLSKNGLSLQEAIAARRVQQAAQDEMRRAEATIRRNLAERGQLGSGNELVQRQMAAQQAANLASRQANDLNQLMLDRQFSALGQYGNLASNVRNTDVNLAQSQAQLFNQFERSRENIINNARAFNAQQANTANQFNTAQQNAASQWNVGQTNQANQWNAAANNQAGMFNANSANEAARNNANAQNTVGMFNAGQTNQANQFNANAQNQAGQFNVGQLNNAAQFNANSANQVGMFNSQLQNQVNLANAGYQNAANQFNANSQNQVGMFNANLAQNVANNNTNTQNQFAQYNMNNYNNLQTQLGNWGLAATQGTANALGNQAAGLDAAEAAKAMQDAGSNAQLMNWILTGLNGINALTGTNGIINNVSNLFGDSSSGSSGDLISGGAANVDYSGGDIWAAPNVDLSLDFNDNYWSGLFGE